MTIEQETGTSVVTTQEELFEAAEQLKLTSEERDIIYFAIITGYEKLLTGLLQSGLFHRLCPAIIADFSKERLDLFTLRVHTPLKQLVIPIYTDATRTRT